jgi:hypothetical protein
MESSVQLPAKPGSRVYGTLFLLENGLREMIIDNLSRVGGPKWWRQRVPGDLQKRAKEGKEYERSQAWQDRAVYHPIYYLDYPDLRALIEAKHNWGDCFSEIFGRKDHTVASLSAVEPARNRIAHCRPCSLQDIRSLETAVALLESAVGSPGRVAELAKRTTSVENGGDAIRRLLDWTLQAGRAIADRERIPQGWEEVRVPEWLLGEAFNPDVLGSLEAFVELVGEYEALPNGVGSAYVTLRWPGAGRIEELLSTLATASSGGGSYA